MPDAVILTAGKATRAGRYAPSGCKALVELDGRPVIEHQIDVLGPDPIIVARSEHATMLEPYGRVIVNDAGKGPADALLSALPHVSAPVTVAYADTYFTELPNGTDWAGVGIGLGGRSWDVIRDGVVAYRYLPPTSAATVCVGLYSFSDPQRVAHIIERILHPVVYAPLEVGLASVLNVYGDCRPVFVPSWQDVGSIESIEAWAS